MNIRLLALLTVMHLIACIQIASAHGYITTESIARNVVECTKPNATLLNCARAIERATLATHSGLANREADSLQVTLENRTLTLIDNHAKDAASFISYSYVGFDRKLNVHIIHVSKYEGDGYTVIHHRTGQQVYVSGYPISSPDGQMFASISEDMFAEFNPNNIEIWKLSSEQIEKVASFLLDWGPENGYWINNNEIRIDKRCYSPTDNNPVALKPCGTAKIQFNKKRWKLFE